MKIEQLGINAVSLHGDYRTLVEAADEAGFKAIEFNVGVVRQFLETGASLADAKRLLDERGLRCIGGFEDNLTAYASPEEVAANREKLKSTAQLLAGLGAQTQVVGTDYLLIEGLENPAQRYSEAFGQLAADVAPLGIDLLIEFNWGAVKTLPLAVQIARDSGAKNLGVLFDPAHFYCTATKMSDLSPENLQYVKHVHVNNMRRKPAELSNCYSDRLLPDDPQGALDLRALFAPIEANGYTGFFSIEMFSEELWAMPARDAAKRLYEAAGILCD
ncbi:MAG TPA: sugar phosphate isomerase/epimerase family protein [Abditibacteriaceae bacterium]